MDGNRSIEGVTGAILAGGRARRFQGLNKATLTIGGARIIDSQLAALKAVTVQQLVIANDLPAFADLDVVVLPDCVARAGPLGGLCTALRYARTPRVLVLACDLPFVHAAFLRFLIERAPAADAVIPRTADGLQPLCAVYATRILPTVEARLTAGHLALHDLADELTVELVEAPLIAGFDPDGRMLANINTPADLERLAAPTDA